MKKLHIQKRFILILFLTAILTIAAAPFYSRDFWKGNYATKHNGIARIDIFSIGDTTNTVELLEATPVVKNEYPAWGKKENGNVLYIEAGVTHNWQKYKLRLKAVKDGKIRVGLKGPCLRADDGHIYPVLVDYRNVKINGKWQFTKRQAHHHNGAYNYNFEVHDGDEFEVSFEVKRHYLRWRDLRKVYHFDYMILLSIMILSFLFSYKSIHYLAKFKLEEQKSRIDIIFLFFFFVILFIPMMNITDAQKSMQENRVLAVKPEFFAQNGVNNKFGEEFNKWFNDRFWGREKIIASYSELKFYLSRYYSNTEAKIYRDDWIFDTYKIHSKISEKKLVEINKGIETYRNFCTEQNLKCYIMIAPWRVLFAKDKIFRNQATLEKDRAEIIAKDVKQKQNFDIIYPLSELLQADKENLVYFKTDHHLTDWGAFVSYQALMEKIKQDFPDLKILQEDDFVISQNNKVRSESGHNFIVGVSCKRLNLSQKNCPLNTEYKYYTHKKEQNLQIIRDTTQQNKDFFAPYALNNQEVFLIGNSFTENLSYFLASSFRKVHKRRCNTGNLSNLRFSRWKDELISSKPDIIIIFIESEYALNLKDLKE